MRYLKPLAKALAGCVRLPSENKPSDSRKYGPRTVRPNDRGERALKHQRKFADRLNHGFDCMKKAANVTTSPPITTPKHTSMGCGCLSARSKSGRFFAAQIGARTS